MNLSHLLGCTLVGTLALFVIAVPRADLYWCQQGSNSALVEQKIEGRECRLIEKDAPPASSKAPSKSSSAAATRPRSPASTIEENNFPLVTPEEQGDRDQTRAAILQLELQDESQKLKDLRELIQRNQQTEANQQAHDFYVRRFERHLQNIKALRQEIAELP